MCGKVGNPPKVYAATLENVFPPCFFFFPPELILYYELSFKYPDVWRLMVVRYVLMHCPREEVVTVRLYMTKA